MLNHSKKIAVNLMEQLDDKEVSAVVADLLNSDLMQWGGAQVSDFQVTESATWRGQAASPVEVNGWRATRFDIRGSVGMTVRKKGHREKIPTFEEYFKKPLPPDACLPEHRREFATCSGGASPPTMPTDLISEPGSEWSDCTEMVDSADRWLTNLHHGGNGEDCLSNASLKTTATHSLDSSSPGLWTPVPRSRASRVPESPRSLGSKRPCDQYRRALAPLLTRAGKGVDEDASTKGFVSDKQVHVNQRVSGSVWLAAGFEVSMKQFIPVLDALSSGNDAIEPFKELLCSEALEEAARQAMATAERAASNNHIAGGVGHVFPVKVSVPVNVAIRGIMHLEAFELKGPDSFPAEVFEVPHGYTWTPRHEAQKTANRRRKRSLIANLAII